MAFKDFINDPATKGAALGFGLGGPIGALIGGSMGQKKRQAEKTISDMTGDIRSRISDRPMYEIPEETKRLMELYGQTAGDIRDVSQQALSAAEARTGAQEAPGMAIAREQAQAAAAGQRQALIEAGGGSAATLGAVAQAGQNELNALRDLSVQNQQYRSQAEQQYLNQLGAHAGMLGSAAQLEGAGLGAMAAERAKVYESELGKYQDLTQFDITQLGNVQAEEQARRNRNAQIASSIIGGVTNIGSSILTGGIM